LKRYFLLFSLGLLLCATSHAQQKKYSFSQTKMGSPLNIILVTDDSLKAVTLAKACYALVDSFNLIYSDYDSSSELSRVNAHAGPIPQKISPALWDIIQSSKTAFRKSKGAFDISVGALSLFWRKARKEKIFPDSLAVLEERKMVGFSKMKFDILNHTLSLPAGMRLDLGGIAKGYIAQKIIDYLKQKDITQALADAGGDMAMSTAPNGSKGWTIGINVPETTDDLLPKKLLLQNMAVATSGDAYQYFEHEGKKYSHIIDPRAGYGISSQRNVTVIAKDGTTADWLATACSILPIEEAKQLAQKMGAEVLITVLKNKKIVYHASSGFNRFWKP
jgi:thiamine biosynthesis lipoprotein